MPEEAMIEASMILHRDSLNRLRGLAAAGALENLSISDALVRMAEDTDVLVEILGRHLEIPEHLIDPVSIRDFLPTLTEIVPRYRRQGSHEHEIYQNLIRNTGNEWITQVLFEEWEFLTSRSWLFAKVRKALDDIVEAGSTAFHASRNKVEQITRRLLNKSPDEPLSPNDKAKAIAKWVAIGGAPVLALFEPISGTAITVIGSVFIVADP